MVLGLLSFAILPEAPFPIIEVSIKLTPDNYQVEVVKEMDVR